MADTVEEQEPSIEDILESIRQIISDEEEEGAEGGDLKADEEPTDKVGDVDLPDEEDDDEPADVEGDVTEDSIEEDVLVLNDVVEEVDGGDLESNTEEDDEPTDIEGDITEDEEIVADIVMEEIEEDNDGGVLMSENTENDDGVLMSENTENAATDSFSKLAANAFIEEEGHAEMMIAPGRITLEQMTRELMRPMLKDWLDSRLPDLVESLVQKEIKKLSDRAK